MQLWLKTPLMSCCGQSPDVHCDRSRNVAPRAHAAPTSAGPTVPPLVAVRSPRMAHDVLTTCDTSACVYLQRARARFQSPSRSAPAPMRRGRTAFGARTLSPTTKGMTRPTRRRRAARRGGKRPSGEVRRTPRMSRRPRRGPRCQTTCHSCHRARRTATAREGRNGEGEGERVSTHAAAGPGTACAAACTLKRGVGGGGVRETDPPGPVPASVCALRPTHVPAIQDTPTSVSAQLANLGPRGEKFGARTAALGRCFPGSRWLCAKGNASGSGTEPAPRPT